MGSVGALVGSSVVSEIVEIDGFDEGTILGFEDPVCLSGYD